MEDADCIKRKVVANIVDKKDRIVLIFTECICVTEPLNCHGQNCME